ncbi:MAG TPA: hypothetical protein VGD67_12085 [Pseudonocardiaceae bacterium]
MSEAAELILAIAALIGSVAGGIATVVTATRRVSPRESAAAAEQAADETAAEDDTARQLEELRARIEELRGDEA